MAQVRDIKLFAKTNREDQMVAEVNFAVEFSQAEIQQNMNYGLYVMLLAVDERMRPQQWDPTQMNFHHDAWRNGERGSFMNENWLRDRVIWIARENINARNCQSRYFTRRCAFQRNNRFNQYPGYCANVRVIPEIYEGRGWSKAVGMRGGAFERNSRQTDDFDRNRSFREYDNYENYAGFSDGGYADGGARVRRSVFARHDRRFQSLIII